MKTGWSPKHPPRPDNVVLAVSLCSSKHVEPGMFLRLLQALRCGLWLSDEGISHFFLNISHYDSKENSTDAAETRKRRTEGPKTDSSALLCSMGNWEGNLNQHERRFNCKSAKLAEAQIARSEESPHLMSKPFREESIALGSRGSRWHR